ncbi:PA1571 family protein [Marinobacter changyiensis]|uniref:PA1571 family protein n=1 Tax=Marinobacter changyiensis TaxID=2604091 RepID=UPI00126463E8|nr:PA1571 family protein [Marinobacter changyiensis]
MTEKKEVMQQKQQSEDLMNGAAIILSDGQEMPITDTMVRQSLDSIVESSNHPSERDQASS